MPRPRTLYEKIFDQHCIDSIDSENYLIYIDRHLIHEVTSPQAFESLCAEGRDVRRPARALALVDHNIPTRSDRYAGIKNIESFIQVKTLASNTKKFSIEFYSERDLRQGIVHVVGPEQGFILPGMTVVCGDSHTSTHGAFGALAFGIGTSEVEHVLATQTLNQRRYQNMRVVIDGTLNTYVSAKDLILYLIKKIGSSGGIGYVIEFSGTLISQLSMEARMTLCNMATECGAFAGLIAPDSTTFSYLKSRNKAPKGDLWEQAITKWRCLYSDPEAVFEKEFFINATMVSPMVTWGLSPEDVISITEIIPDLPLLSKDINQQKSYERALAYMDLKPNLPILGLKIDCVFIGSCTNSRIEDLRIVAQIVQGHKISSNVSAIIVPGSGLVKQQAEKERLDLIFKATGFEWRESGCSMCLGMNEDRLSPYQRCASTSNRNFEGRQGPLGRTHLVSPAMAAAAAIAGCFVDVREFAIKKTPCTL